MGQEDVLDSLRILISSRARVLGPSYEQAASQFEGWPVQQLIEALPIAPRPQRTALGLLVAKASLEDALSNPSKSSLNRFLFRYGAHLKTSVSESGITASKRLCLALAAEIIFNALPTATTKQRAEVRGIRSRLAEVEVTDREWRETVGLIRRDFENTAQRIGRGLNEPERRTAFEQKPASGRLQKPSKTRERPTVSNQPAWLTVDFQGLPDPLVAATANWRRAREAGDLRADISQAWAAFRDGDHTSAFARMLPTISRLGDEWGPSSGVDTLRSWNWIRLVSELATLQAGRANDVRRSRASASLFASRCLPDDEDLLGNLVYEALDDFAAGDLPSSRAWAVYSIRLVADLGHETALTGYSNAEKAQLRAAWSKQFGLMADESRSTAEAALAAVPQFKELTQRLYLGARDDWEPARVLREVSHKFTKFLDEAEHELYQSALDATEDSQRIVDAETTNHRDLKELLGTLNALRETIASSSSSVLQDFVAPLVQKTILTVERASERLGDLSRPQVSLQLASAKVPFSAATGSTYQIRFVVQNTGNAVAEGIRIRVTQAEIGLDSYGTLESLGPGAQTELSVKAVASGSSGGAVTLDCQVSWSDALLQDFSNSVQLLAEDQGPVSWTSADVNPFNLGTISDPERLVGRDEDLFSLDALIAGGGSAYVTGHKRVGKTSLTRVLLKSLRSRRGWAGSVLPLGRAIVDGQTAGDLVSALLDEILVACEDAYPRDVKGMKAVEFDGSGNFARGANRWINAMARALPEGARVVIAIDDFDELPSHLVEGAQADALFLFLRSLVDEPWLNLIVVGSEVLPSIIQKQAHKLNQVAPVPVTNFRSRESTAALVVTPSQDRIEWVSEAIESTTPPLRRQSVLRDAGGAKTLADDARTCSLDRDVWRC